MKGSSKRLLAGIAGVFLLVPAVREPIGHRKKEKSWK